MIGKLLLDGSAIRCWKRSAKAVWRWCIRRRIPVPTILWPSSFCEKNFTTNQQIRESFKRSLAAKKDEPS